MGPHKYRFLFSHKLNTTRYWGESERVHEPPHPQKKLNQQMCMKTMHIYESLINK